jgi:hypothetical protein
MIKATVALESLSPLAQNRHHETPKLQREIEKDYETRTWIERAHIDENGNLFIPPLALKNCLCEAAKFISMQIPGKGKSTYTKHFEAGVLVVDPLMTGIKKEDITPLWLFVPADGKRGSGKRVNKAFPYILKWKSTATVYIIDEIITKEILQEHLDKAGQFIGLGALRVRNQGICGRFKAEVRKWEKTT